MNSKRIITIVIASLFLCSCSTLKDSLLLGGGIGATTGGVVGNFIGTANGNTTTGTMIGAGSGLLLGALIGYSAYKNAPKANTNTKAVESPQDSKTPSLSAPVVRKIWVPSKIENNKFIEGHFEFVIERQSVWIDQ